MLKFRTDLFYSLIAFESVLVAVAAIMWFPVWVLAVAIAAFIFATAEMIVNIAKMKKVSYNEEKGKSDYKFPIIRFVLYAAMLLCLTATAILAIKRLFGFGLVTLALFAIVLLIFGYFRKVNLLRMIACALIAVLAVFLVSYGVARLVHSGVKLNPGLISEETTVTGNETEPSESETEAPGSETEVPGSDTEEPGSETEAPGSDTEEPGDTPEPPIVTTKINAPDTMSYGKPITIDLEGISADNLKYGGEDFVSIVKVSDTQVVLTLVGIVNDEGQVEIVPASGYITITDSVSGTNASIRVVE